MGICLRGKEAQEKYNKLKENGLIIFECIVGSTAYGTSIKTSDVDKKFIFINTLEQVLIGEDVDQISITDDYVGYELKRFVELLDISNINLN